MFKLCILLHGLSEEMGNVKRQWKGTLLAAASVLTAIAFLWASVASATPALLTGDAYTSALKPDLNLGKTETLYVTSNATGLIKFSLSTLPTGTVGADISKATLTLFVASMEAAGSFDVVRVTSA